MGAAGKRGEALIFFGGLMGAFVTRMPYTNVTNNSSLLRYPYSGTRESRERGSQGGKKTATAL